MLDLPAQPTAPPDAPDALAPGTFAPCAARDACLTIAGQRLVLLPERAILWGTTLLVADLHLGKGEAMCRLGVGVPRVVLDESLDRLSRAVVRTGASRVLVLGDLLHAPLGITQGLVERVRAWRDSYPGDVTLVPGNHDRALARVADAWHLRLAPDVLHEAPFAFAHDPQALREHHSPYAWCGHIHPAVRLGPPRLATSLPAFLLSRAVGVLPAFSAFTAGAPVRPAPHDRLYVVADGRVMELTA
ncbi:MAG: ligase-associated DNA damage response endonuclease PdeM [Planctomycetota bacterium]|nr:ligase-associated DNA damage response endonuclease PdeM [Planctomycetota bacterium]